MVMTDLCDPFGDSALRDGGFQNLYPEPKSYLIRFSVKQANGFCINDLTDLLHRWNGHFLLKTKTIYITYGSNNDNNL